MWKELVIIVSTCNLCILGHCIDIHSHIISQGLHYVPGPNSCTLCICDQGSPKWCKSVLCSHPQNCKSFQRGNSCCEFKCLDDILAANDTFRDTYDLALKFIASAVFVILTLSLLVFALHKFRKQKRSVSRNHQINEESRTLSNIGYLAESVRYLPENIRYIGSASSNFDFEESGTQYALWKPSGNYFPPGEAPPPYEEAIRSSQIESNLTDDSLLRRTIPQSRAPVQCCHQVLTSYHSTNSSANQNSTFCHTEPTVKARNRTNTKGGELKYTTNLPLNQVCIQLQRSKHCENAEMPNKGHIVCSRTSTSPTHENNLKRKAHTEHASTCKKYHTKHSKQEIIKLIDTSRMHCTKSCEGLYENVPCTKRSKSRPCGNKRERQSATGNAGETARCSGSTPNTKRICSNDYKELLLHRTLPKDLKECMESVADVACCKEANNNHIHRSLPNHFTKNKNILLSVGSYVAPINLQTTDNEMSVGPTLESDNILENSSCISYNLSQDEEDYRSECENCRSSEIPNSKDEEDIISETMTLQRRLESIENIPYYRTSLTLPTQIRKPRAVTRNPTREEWFMAVQEVSSSEESE